MTQCHEGGVNDLYETGRALVNLGAVLGNDMTTECCLAKLSYLFGKKYSVNKIKKMMMQSLRGELTDIRSQQNQFSLENSELVNAVARTLNVQDNDEIRQISSTIMPLLANSVASLGNLSLMESLAT
jgi:lysophospholipase